jgi:CubicO group peptidase (beta-lactamase class C family)
MATYPSTPVTEHLTLVDALTHRTGMPRHDKVPARHYDSHQATVRDVVRSLRYRPLNAEPRTKFQYCNLMFVVVSHAIETLISRWLGHVLKDWIWSKPDMTDTYFSLDDALKSEHYLATGYYFDDDAKEFGVVPPLHPEEISGAGSVMPNVLDYARWIQSLIDESSAQGDQDAGDGSRSVRQWSLQRPAHLRARQVCNFIQGVTVSIPTAEAWTLLAPSSSPMTSTKSACWETQLSLPTQSVRSWCGLSQTRSSESTRRTGTTRLESMILIPSPVFPRARY